MNENENSGELTIREMIEVKLCGIEAVIDTVGDDEPQFNDHRSRLKVLLSRLDRNQITPEYAECELEKISDEEDRWLRDHPTPPD
jgi:hypothetical protein